MKSRIGLIALTLCASAACAQTTVTKAPFGKTPDGAPVDAYTLKDKTLTVKIITWGAHIIEIDAPDRNGKDADVVLGYKSMDAPNAGYIADNGKTYMGSVVGRYGNRIAGGKFTIDGKAYQVDVNETKVGNTLHGGKVGFDRKNWTAKEIPDGVELTLVSPDGDMGFPGTLTAHVRYTLEGDKLKLAYTATTDKPTVINLTNHSYFNLAGSGTILDEVMQINADRYTPINAASIPLGDLPSVAGTPFDFRKPTPIGARIHDDNEQLKLAKGYDHNFVLNPPHTLTHAAVVVTDPASGRTLTVYTTEPGVQFYTGNFLDGTLTGRSGQPYVQYDGFCLETQHFPDSPNHPKFPSTTLRPGETYHTTTVFQFTAK
jgi:aldose 1-epimerase